MTPGFMPIGLWETLISDTASRGANDEEDGPLMNKGQDIRNLTQIPVAGGFLGVGGAEYFQKWRGHLGVEEWAMFDAGKDLVEQIGPLVVSSTEQWPSMKLEGRMKI